MEGVEATTDAARSCNNVAGNLGWNSTNQEDACAANERTWKVNIFELKIANFLTPEVTNQGLICLGKK